MRKNIIVIIISLIFIPKVFGQISETDSIPGHPPASKPDSARKDTVEPAKVMIYKFYSDYTGLHDVFNDTSLVRFQVYDKPFKNLSLNEYLGNPGLAYTSLVASDRKDFKDFSFEHYVDYNYHTPENTLYYKVRSPYTLLNYYTAGPKTRQEQFLHVLHTQNVNEKFNVGVDGDLAYSDGQLQNERSKGNYISFFTSYKGKRYSIYANLNFNSHKFQESGGLFDDSLYITNKDITEATVNMTNANTTIKSRSVSLLQRFYLTGSYKDDSLNRESKWNEVVSIIHKLEIQRHTRAFSDVPNTSSGRNNEQILFYGNGNALLDSSKTYDSTYFRRIENDFLMALNARQLLKIPAELRFGIKNQIDRFSYNYYADSSIYKFRKPDEFNTALVGYLFDRFSKTFSFGASAELFITGYKTGNITIRGDIRKIILNNFILAANGQFSSIKPGYFIHEFKANYIQWNTPSSTSNQVSSVVNGIISHTKLDLSLEGHAENLVNYLYFDSVGKPAVAGKQFSIYMLTLKKGFKLGILHSYFSLTAQRSGNTEALPLPSFTGFNSTYIQVDAVKNVLRFQFGADTYFHTKYYALDYMPATGVFFAHRSYEIGNYPLINVFLNISLKRARFFFTYDNLSSFFNLEKSFYAPHYPFNPGILKVGISWKFYD